MVQMQKGDNIELDYQQGGQSVVGVPVRDTNRDRDESTPVTTTVTTTVVVRGQPQGVGASQGQQGLN